MKGSTYTPKGDIVSNFILAGTSAALVKTLISPIEIIKIYSLTHANYLNNKNPHIVNTKNFFEYMTSIIRQRGLAFLWSGNVRNILRYAPNQGYNFAFKDFYRKFFFSLNADTTFPKFLLGNLVSGGAAGATVLLSFYPINTARNQIITDLTKSSLAKPPQSIPESLKMIYKTKGFAGLYKGVRLPLIGAVAYRACYFGGYDTLTKVITSKDWKLDLLMNLAVARIVAGASDFVSFPIAIIQKRLSYMGTDGQPRYKGVIDCVRQTVQKEGAKTFFNGVSYTIHSPRGLGSTLLLVFYDHAQRKLPRRF